MDGHPLTIETVFGERILVMVKRCGPQPIISAQIAAIILLPFTASRRSRIADRIFLFPGDILDDETKPSEQRPN